MKTKNLITTSFCISDSEIQDSISVIICEYGKGQAKVILEVWGQSWSHYWGGMGDESIYQFLQSADVHYLTKKFAIGAKLEEVRSLRDASDIQRYIAEMVSAMESNGEISRKQAEEFRTLATRCEYGVGHPDNVEILEKVFGSDWYHDYCPREKNPDYTYLEEIVEAVKEAVPQMLEVLAYERSNK